MLAGFDTRHDTPPSQTASPKFSNGSRALRIGDGAPIQYLLQYTFIAAVAEDGKMTVGNLLLTGTRRGIGPATVKAFQAAGWCVLTVSRSAFYSRSPWHAGPADHIRGGLKDSQSRADLVARIRENLDGAGLDAIVNNAGISPRAEDGGRLGLETTHAVWSEVLNVTLIAPAALMRHLAPELAVGCGTVVNVGSIVGGRVHPFAGTAYACAKSALETLTRAAAAEFRPKGVRVNMVTPGMVTPGEIATETSLPPATS